MWLVDQIGLGVDATLPATVPDTGNPVTNGTNLQTAINAAAAGATIVVQSGAEYRGNFTIPSHSGPQAITIRSTIGLPVGVRVSPSQVGLMARLTTASSTAVIEFLTDSAAWNLTGLAITTSGQYPTSVGCHSLVIQTAGISYGHWPKRLLFDRVMIYAPEADPLPYRSADQGLVIDGESITVQHSYIYNFTGWEYPTMTAGQVTTVSNASPAQVTFASDPGLSGNPGLCFFEGGTGAWAALNGLKLVTKTDATHGTVENFDSAFTRTNLNSTAFGSFGGQAITMGSQSGAVSQAIVIQVGPGPYTFTNNFIEAYFTAIFTGGSSTTWVDPANTPTISSVNSISQVVMSSVTNLQVGDVFSMNGSALQTITATADAGGGLTYLTVTTHRFPAGSKLGNQNGQIVVAGLTGAWAACNGTYRGDSNAAFAVDSTHISIPVVSTGFAGSSTGTWELDSATDGPSSHQQVMVGKVTNIAGTTVDYDFWGHQPTGAGHGAGIPTVAGATVQYRGLNLNGITMTHNTVANRRYWIGVFRDRAMTCNGCSSQTTKGLWECKMASGVTLTGNIFTLIGGSMDPNDDMAAFAINQANQLGLAPWITVSNWLVQNNLFHGICANNVSYIEEYGSGQISTGFVFRNNLLTYARSVCFSLQGGDGMEITHNTFRNDSNTQTNAFIVITHPETNSIVQNNVASFLIYGYPLVDDGSPWIFTARDHNYLIDTLNQGFTAPTGDTRVATNAAMLFVNVAAADAGGDYHGYALQAGSPGHLAASDGTDVGVNFTTLDAALAGNDGLGSL